jgi:hypothetical protein
LKRIRLSVNMNKKASLWSLPTQKNFHPEQS